MSWVAVASCLNEVLVNMDSSQQAIAAAGSVRGQEDCVLHSLLFRVSCALCETKLASATTGPFLPPSMGQQQQQNCAQAPLQQQQQQQAGDHHMQPLPQHHTSLTASSRRPRSQSAWLLVLLAFGCRSCTALAPPEPLVDCLKNGQHNQLTTYKNFVDGKPARWAATQIESAL